MSAVVVSLLVALGVVVAAMAITTVIAQRTNRVAVVDVTWGAGFVLVAWATAVVGLTADAGTAARTLLVAVLVTLWGGRLAWHIRGRAVGEGEDPRYRKILGGEVREIGIAPAVRQVFVVQGVAMFVIALPVTLGAVREVAWWPVVVIGGLVWVVGVVFESVGDAQLAAYKRIPKAERPPVMDQGLWRYTRHPNYFGDACVWWGLWLAAGLGSGWVVGLITVIAPIAMSFFLVFATGAKLLEREMMKRDGYPEYADRTSMFFPLPPKSSRA